MSKDKKDPSKGKKHKRPREEEQQQQPSTTTTPTTTTTNAIQSEERPPKKLKRRHNKVHIIPYASPIAVPKAETDLTKKIFETIKKANAVKACFKGIKVIEKAFRKGEKGFVILAADVYPIDIISHFPVLCEDYNIPYIFVTSKYSISAALAIKRPVSALFISSKCQEKLQDQYQTCFKAIKDAQNHLVV